MLDRRGFLGLLAGAAAGAISRIYGRQPVEQFPAIPVVTSAHQPRGRVDFINLNNWGRVPVPPIDFYDVGGQSVFPYKKDSSVGVFYLTSTVELRSNA